MARALASHVIESGGSPTSFLSVDENQVIEDLGLGHSIREVREHAPFLFNWSWFSRLATLSL
eukprot:3750430-Amphidinium_carterae.1